MENLKHYSTPIKYDINKIKRPFPKRKLTNEMSEKELLEELVANSRNNINYNYKSSKKLSNISMWMNILGVLTVLSLISYVFVYLIGR